MYFMAFRFNPLISGAELHISPRPPAAVSAGGCGFQSPDKRGRTSHQGKRPLHRAAGRAFQSPDKRGRTSHPAADKSSRVALSSTFQSPDKRGRTSHILRHRLDRGASRTVFQSPDKRGRTSHGTRHDSVLHKRPGFNPLISGAELHIKVRVGVQELIAPVEFQSPDKRGRTSHNAITESGGKFKKQEFQSPDKRGRTSHWLSSWNVR